MPSPAIAWKARGGKAQKCECRGLGDGSRGCSENLNVPSVEITEIPSTLRPSVNRRCAPPSQKPGLSSTPPSIGMTQ